MHQLNEFNLPPNDKSSFMKEEKEPDNVHDSAPCPFTMEGTTNKLKESISKQSLESSLKSAIYASRKIKVKDKTLILSIHDVDAALMIQKGFRPNTDVLEELNAVKEKDA
jgi:hypothetical protein